MKLKSVLGALLAAGMLGTMAVAQAGLFGKSEDEFALKARPFDFAAAMSKPESIAGDYLDTYDTEPIKGVKRVIIPNFQVRFCMQDDAQKTVSTNAAGWEWTSSSLAGVDVEISPALRQRLTDQLYARFVERLKANGIEVVPLDSSLKLAELANGIKNSPANGSIEELYSFAGRETEAEKKQRQSSAYNWAIHFPSQTTALNYTGIMEGFGPMGSWARVAELAVLPPSMIKVAKAQGTGLLTVGYEVRLEKMTTGVKPGEGFFGKPTALVKAAPVLRTRLLGFKLMPENGDAKVMAIGMSGGLNFTGMNFDGLGIQPVASASPFGGPKYGNFPWIEMDASYNGLRGTELEGSWVLEPEADKLEADLMKAMDAQYSLLFHLLEKNLK